MIEEKLERLIVAIERGNDLRERGILVAEWNRARLEGTVGAPSEAKAPVGEAPAPEETAEAGINRDALLARCAKLGIEVPSRTKTPTLVKLIEKALSAPAAPEVPATPAAPVDPLADSFGTKPAAPATEPLTEEKAREILTKNWKHTKEEGEALRGALDEFKIGSFNDISGMPVGTYEKVIASFHKRLGVA